MKFFPDFTTFEGEYARGRSQVLWTQVHGEFETPSSAFLKVQKDHEYSVFFESVRKKQSIGQYSFIGLDPDLIWECRGDRARMTLMESGRVIENDTPLLSLRETLEWSGMRFPSRLPPMAAGLFGFMSYDIVRFFERLPNRNPDPLKIPEAVFIRPKIVIVLDHDAATHTLTLITPIWRDSRDPARVTVSAERAYQESKDRLIEILGHLDRQIFSHLDRTRTLTGSIEVKPLMSREEYCEVVERAKRYIYQGDILQIVPSQRFEGRFLAPPFTFYQALSRLNPSPFSFYLRLKEFVLVGSSPEILVRVRDNEVTIRPIAGTRRRGRTPREDRVLKKELLSDPKELSEHLMLLDLGRNDVGRVSKIGSVRVTNQMKVDYYSHVMHIVSNIKGRLLSECTALDALMAGFPAGTVSGAPKIRAMEIIDELERFRRSFYAGCVGYFSSNGSMDTCISIRTALIKDEKIYIQAGGGVVAESVAEDEYEETLNKAQVLIRAAEKAHEFYQEQLDIYRAIQTETR